MLPIVGAIIAPPVLITGLLYYFGWVRTQATFAYFGIDTSLIGSSTSDYVMRSVNVAFETLIRVAVIALALLFFHRLVVLRALGMPEESRARRAVRWFVVIVHVIGISLAAAVIAGVLAFNLVGQPFGLAAPLLLIASVTLLGYVIYLRSAYPDALNQTCRYAPRVEVDQDVVHGRDQQNDQFYNDADKLRRGKGFFCTHKGAGVWLSSHVNPHSWVEILVLLLLGLLGVIWAVSLYAEQFGTIVATRFVDDLQNESVIVIYSTERIAIAGTGVNVDEIAQPDSKYRYQYSGLRLLVRSTDKYLLLPVGWQRGRDRAFIVHDDETIRIDVRVTRPEL